MRAHFHRAHARTDFRCHGVEAEATEPVQHDHLALIGRQHGERTLHAADQLVLLDVARAWIGGLGAAFLELVRRPFALTNAFA
jgi:hypothetical protein